MKKKLLALTLLIMTICMVGCGDSVAVVEEELTTNSGEVQVEIEEVDSSEITEQVIPEKKRKPIKVAVIGAPSTNILEFADAAMMDTDYCIEQVVCSDYKSPNEMVINGEALACLTTNQVLLDSYNMVNESDLVMAEYVYIDPLAIFPGKVKDIKDCSTNMTVAVSSGDVNVARALYLLEQKGIVSIKPGALYQATMEDVTSDPYNISIEQVDLNNGWPDVNKYGIIISDYNRAVVNGIDPTTAIGEENRNSGLFDLFAVGLAVKEENVDSKELKSLIKAINSEEVEEQIETSFYKSVLDYK